MPQQEHIKRVKHYDIERVLDEYTKFSTTPNPTPFFEGENEISKKLGRGSNF